MLACDRQWRHGLVESSDSVNPVVTLSSVDIVAARDLAMFLMHWELGRFEGY